jgi:hypothetical protein
MDSDPDPKQDMHLIKNHQKISNLIITGMTLKNLIKPFFKSMIQNTMKMPFYCWHCERENS